MKTITLLLFALFLTAVSYGQTLISWEVGGITNLSDGSSPYTFSGTTGTNVSGGDLTLGSGVNPTTSSGQYGFKVSGANAQTSLEGAITNNHYIQFTVSADSGYVLNLSSLELNGETSGTGSDNVDVLTSVGGFTASAAIASLTGRQSIGAGDLDTDSSGFGSAINLSGEQFQNLSSITFRIYGWNTSSGAGLTYIRNQSGNDLVINGTTAASAVPEPSTYALIFGAAMLGFCIYRRRAKQVS